MASNQLGEVKRKRLSADPDVVRRRLQREQRRADAMQLRMAGASYMDIVKANIGYKTPAHVGQDIRRALDDFRDSYEEPASLLALDLARIDDIHRRVYVAFHAGDISQAGMLLRIIAFRREVLGHTPETIKNAMENPNALVNNGIMVVQGSAEDYLKTMMQAAGASPEQQRAELDRIAASNRASGRTAHTEAIMDAEVVDDGSESTSAVRPKKKLRKLRRPVEKTAEQDFPADSEELEKSLLQLEEMESPAEKLPTLQLSDPILSIDIPEDERPRKKRLRVRVKPEGTNMNPSSGVPYRAAPRKPDPETSEKRLLAKGARATSSGPNRADVFPGGNGRGLLYDEIETETLSQRID